MKNAIIIGVLAVTILVAGCGKRDGQQQIVIRIDSDKTLLVADKPCLQDELSARLTRLTGNQDTVVVIRATNPDDDQINAIADTCKKAGVKSISYSLVKF